MNYIRGNTQARLEGLKARQQAAASEALRVEAELDAILGAERDLARTQRRREKALTELHKIRENFTAEAEAAEADLVAMREARREIAAAARKAVTATGKAQRELKRAEEAEIDLHRLQRERSRIAGKIEARNAGAIATIQQIIREPHKLPPPIYGGRDGLNAAVREAGRHGHAA